MSAPAITVVLPVYNGGKFLAQCLESVLAQTLGNFELIVADDASTDNSRAIIDKIADARTVRCFRDSNVGLFANLNLAVAEAKAPLVRFLCQDDVLMPDCLAAEVDFFNRHGDVSMFYSKVLAIDETGREVDRAQLNDLPEQMPPTECYQHFFYHECIPGNLSTVAVAREEFLRVGGFDDSFRFAADFELWVRLCADRPMGVVHQYLVKLRMHKNQLSRSPDALVDIVRERRRIRRKVRTRLPGAMLSTADRFEKWQLDVADANAAVHSIRSGRWSRAWEIAGILGARRLSASLVRWFVSGNNRWYRPPKEFFLDAQLRDVSTAA